MRLAALLVGLFALVSPGAAHAETPSGCEERVRAWVNGCPHVQAECVRAAVCAPGAVIVEGGCSSGERLRVEIARASARSFHKVGEVGLSPVGDFPDWSQADPWKRRLLEELERCAAEDPSLVVPAVRSKGSPAVPAPSAGAPVPWRLVLAVGLGTGALFARRRRSDVRRTAAILLAVWAGTLVLRALLFPFAFFHPNGQGAFWIGFALDAGGPDWAYGPGFRELYGWVAGREGASPERLVFGAQAVAGAASVACAWVLGRELGGGRLLAWASAAVVAASPILARISQSQSYYATWTSLLFLAGAVLAAGTPRPGEGRLSFALAVSSAGLFVAQAARVSPIGWLSAAALPLIVFAGRGPIRRRLVLAGAAAGGIALVVAAASGRAMWSVLQGALGAQWLPEVRVAGLSDPGALLSVAPLLVVMVLASQDRMRAVTLAAALFATAYGMDRVCLVRSDPAPFQRAYAAMWAPVLLGLSVALAGGLRTARLRAVGAAALCVLALVGYGRTFREDRELFTSELEARWAEEWRGRLPAGSTVVYLSRVGPHVLSLPLYGARSRVGVEPWTLSHEDALPALGHLGPDTYYYESSLCASREARDFCRRLRARHELEGVEERTLPARAGAGGALFEEATVTVGLFRVR